MVRNETGLGKGGKPQKTLGCIITRKKGRHVELYNDVDLRFDTYFID